MILAAEFSSARIRLPLLMGLTPPLMAPPPQSPPLVKRRTPSLSLPMPFFPRCSVPTNVSGLVSSLVCSLCVCSIIKEIRDNQCAKRDVINVWENALLINAGDGKLSGHDSTVMEINCRSKRDFS